MQPSVAGACAILAARQPVNPMKTCPVCKSAYMNEIAFCPRDGAALKLEGEWRAGVVVRGKYRILAKIGEGGMGAVYKAEHVRFGELRALKVLGPGHDRNRELLRRFELEAVNTRRLQHPHVVRVEDIDTTEDGHPFMVMEFIEGRSLMNVIEEEGPLSARRTCTIVKQVASALDAAHGLGLIHRDIKPHNILLLATSQGEQAKVLDFGIAKMKDLQFETTAAVSFTRDGAILGTPHYMSPEQAAGKRGSELDGRSDIYSLGVTMYEMLTCNLPFKTKSTMEMVRAHMEKAPTPIDAVRPGLQIPKPLSELVMSCLEKDPEKRPRNAATLIAVIEGCEPSLSTPAAVASRHASSGPGARAVSSTAITIPMPSMSAQWRRPRYLLPPAAALLLVALAVLLWLKGHRPSQSPPGVGHTALAVLYISNQTQEPKFDWLNHGLADMFSTSLGQFKGVDVVPARRILDEVERLGKREITELNLESSREVAQNASASAFITGSLRRLGSKHLRLHVQAVDAQTNQILASSDADGEDIRDISDMVDKATSGLAQKFVSSVKPAPKLADVGTADPDARQHYYQGIDLLGRYDYSGAIQEFLQAIKFDRNYGEAYWHLSLAYRLQGDLGKSKDLWPTIQKLESHMPREESLEFDAYRDLWNGDTDKGRKVLETLVGDYPRQDEARAYLADVLRYQGEAAHAVQVLDDGLRTDPRNTTLLNAMCPAQMDAGNKEGAILASNEYIKLSPNDPNPLDTRGDFLYQYGYDDEALQAYDQAIAIKPDFQDYLDYLKVAFVQASLKNFPLADLALEKYAKQATGAYAVYLPVFDGQFKEMQGELGGARASFQRAVKELARAGQTEGAGVTLKSMCMISILTGKGVSADLAFAREQKLSGWENEAIAYLQAAQGDAAGYEQALTAYAAQLGLGQQEVDRARKLSSLYGAMSHNDPQKTSNLADSLPSSIDSVIVFPRGWAYLQSKEYSWAERDLRAAIRDERSLSDFDTIRTRCPLRAALAHFYLGQLYDRSGKRDQAEREYNTFLLSFESSKANLDQVAQAKTALRSSFQ